MDDDDDFDEDDFEAKYLSSGINLESSSSSNISKNEKNRQTIIDNVQSNVTDSYSINFNNQNQINTSTSLDCTNTPHVKNKISPIIESSISMDSKNSDLTKIAIQHLDKHQWQLPLMEMDKKFRDKTYYKHYTDTYISSLRSKLGHFMADNQLIENPMKYHIQQELDNYSKYSRMFALLTEYYQSIGTSFFTFATPSPDEEIVIGCRLGTKGYYR